ncbi:MAG TPA: hypothetical protein VNE39_22485 [Planctomycetota bacterium]|nr:hypothetical protein [Planctomycetota bacterium]
MPRALGLARFYRKYVDCDGLPVVGSEKVPDAALLEARRIVKVMMAKRPDVLQAIARKGIRLAVMAKTEVTTDIPEHSDLTPRDFWAKRARGLGATTARPAISCAEENLLGYGRDKYWAECILIHEFAHTVHEIGLAETDKSFDTRLKQAYEAAMKKGLWQNTYAGKNRNEYWAEGVQAWYNAANYADPPNGVHNQVNRRDVLKAYDPALAALIEQVFGDTECHPAQRFRSGPKAK